MVKDDFVVPAVKREPASMHFVVLMPGAEIDGDPEITYLFAGICGAAARARWQCDSCKPQARQTTARIARRITDPVLANIRGIPKFREIRAAGIACQKNFDAQRGAVTPGLLLTIPALARLQAKLTDLLPLVSS